MKVHGLPRRNTKHPGVAAAAAAGAGGREAAEQQVCLGAEDLPDILLEAGGAGRFCGGFVRAEWGRGQPGRHGRRREKRGL
jgi:hypothetical protein